jgi:hypothetical protein
MIDADTLEFGGKYRAALSASFVNRKIIPPTSVLALRPAPGKMLPQLRAYLAPAAGQPAGPRVHQVLLRAADFGLPGRTLTVDVLIQQQSFHLAAATLLHTNSDPVADVEAAAHRFVKMLVGNKRIATGTNGHHSADRARGVRTSAGRTRRYTAETHAIENGKLVRRRFHCGCRCGHCG